MRNKLISERSYSELELKRGSRENHNTYPNRSIILQQRSDEINQSLTPRMTGPEEEGHVVDVLAELFQHSRIGRTEEFVELSRPVGVLGILLEVVHVQHS